MQIIASHFFLMIYMNGTPIKKHLVFKKPEYTASRPELKAYHATMYIVFRIITSFIVTSMVK